MMTLWIPRSFILTNRCVSVSSPRLIGKLAPSHSTPDSNYNKLTPWTFSTITLTIVLTRLYRVYFPSFRPTNDCIYLVASRFFKLKNVEFGRNIEKNQLTESSSLPFALLVRYFSRFHAFRVPLWMFFSISTTITVLIVY